jgi:hypothetical protein
MTVLTGELAEYLASNSLELIPFHGVDQAWGYRENEPVFAFISDPSDGSMAFQNAMSLYWATAEYISRPWCLFMITGSPMMPHHRQMLVNLATQYNIKLLESPSQEELLALVRAQLIGLTSIMNRYIEPGAENPSESFGESIREWKEQKPVLEEITSVEIKVWDLSQYAENGLLVPSRITVPLTVQSGGSSIEGILPRLIQEEPLVFYTEHRNLPIVFNLDFGKKTLTTRFEADKGTLIEASSYESLITAFKSTGEISFIDQNTGNSVFDLSVNR